MDNYRIPNPTETSKRVEKRPLGTTRRIEAPPEQVTWTNPLVGDEEEER